MQHAAKILGLDDLLCYIQYLMNLWSEVFGSVQTMFFLSASNYTCYSPRNTCIRFKTYIIEQPNLS